MLTWRKTENFDLIGELEKRLKYAPLFFMLTYNYSYTAAYLCESILSLPAGIYLKIRYVYKIIGFF